MRFRWSLLGMILGLALIGPGVQGPIVKADEQPEFSDQQIEFFENEIRPLLVERCHKCHGSDEQKGGLRLDSRDAILNGGDTGPAIVREQPDDSELVRAIRYGDDGYQMPPDGKLPQQDIDRLVKWVSMGAPWHATDSSNPDDSPSSEIDVEERAKHWSFQPLKRPDIPVVENGQWCRTPVDRFLLARLEEQGIAPADAADLNTWLRRVSLDVIGLPPTPDELATFLAHDSPQAAEAVIERLLASPHFGERWSRHWLDLVRYAESRGHEFDYDVANPWHYRDYVIRAINDDVPYDQFVVEHVAGDLLASEPRPSGRGEHVESAEEVTIAKTGPGANASGSEYRLRIHPQTGGNESILATGFWYLGEWVHSPVDIRQDEADRFANMIDVYSKTFLGLTVACARCHDHKFDPITQKDFYALQGYLQSTTYRQARFETMEHNGRMIDSSDHFQVRTDDPHELLVCGGDGDSVETDWSPRDLLPDPAPLWRLQQLNASEDSLSEPSSQSANVRTPSKWWSLRADSPDLQSANDDHEPGATSSFLPGVRLRSPTFELRSGKLHCLVRGGVDVYVAVDSHILINGPLHGSLVRKVDQSPPAQWRWISVDVSRYSGHKAHIEFSPRLGEGSGIARVVQSSVPPMAVAEEDVKTIEPTSAGSPTEDNRFSLTSAIAPAMLDGNGEDEYVFIRGNWKKSGEVVKRRFLEVFNGDETPCPESGSGRLQLAEQMVDPEQTPILPRVMVNRIWQHYFGVGLVSTPDDFGHMGRPPSHPELLDWLACELVDHNWSLKHIHRLILNSNAYRMSSVSEPRPSGRGQDVTVAENEATAHAGPVADASGSEDDSQPSTLNPQLFARMPVKRLEGEIIRDAMLRLSGRLDDSLYGRSVPVHLTPFMEGRGRPKESGPVDGAGRRSLYVAVRRNFPDPFFQAFDMPNPHTTSGRRTVSNVPAQALAMMNNPMVIELSHQWAERLQTGFPDGKPEVRIRHAYLACVSREPTDSELSTAIEFVSQQAHDLSTTTDDSRIWGDLCQVLLNTKEFLFVQ